MGFSPDFDTGMPVQQWNQRQSVMNAQLYTMPATESVLNTVWPRDLGADSQCSCYSLVCFPRVEYRCRQSSFLALYIALQPTPHEGE